MEFNIATEYSRAVKSLADKGFAGGFVYDGLIVFCAEKSGAEKIVTANTPDFTRLAEACGLPIEIIGL
ncbi:MAG: hypothetical protein KDD06_22645 [Phaeodactylibacter sp.]|nr:hypothetical protein [Phaeodactylibacter sp.]MCB9265090.1 hypothetical protein [Lewinellaceae bacterium]